VFGCNFLGILCGLLTLKLFSVRKFDWIYVKEKKLEDKGNCSMVSKTLSKFRPVFFLKHDWKVFSSVGIYMGVIAYICQCLIVDLGNFFGKFVLAIPPEHDLLKVRLFIMAHMAVSASEE
jgi:Phosphatidyl serine synthase